MKVNIAIDGPAGAGKSTVSKEIAQRLKYTFINSGSVYRAIAYNALQQGANLKNKDEVLATLQKGMIELQADENVILNGHNITKIIRSENISLATPIVAKIQQVRDFVVEFIQEMTKKEKGFIIDGRDTTFKIMPHAELKIFLWADPKERAQRRYLQNNEMGYQTSYEEVLYDIKQRDAQDMNREIDPLHKTEDAFLIDCTDLEIEEVIQKIIELVKRQIKVKNA
ncbi:MULTISPECIES: (d)CMP kinase [unclassified Mycoplasma]|uniref:(d)CMP kinase n=1 Tax=unclassified Mycoplasma TaxID=2683645 RepID=UPI00211CDFB6|nr:MULTISPECIES: (d)CMP kinase [unclassified Mycoplasma]UUM19522.1 (d)CMP kinase [Mycoplasma sp. 1578d]UUM24442.1 (d)CMP kinase [Mycoplasma sp. 3686d]